MGISGILYICGDLRTKPFFHKGRPVELDFSFVFEIHEVLEYRLDGNSSTPEGHNFRLELSIKRPTGFMDLGGFC